MDVPAIERVILDLLSAVGEDPARPGLVETPGRVASAWAEMLSGYAYDDDAIHAMLKTFIEDTADVDGQPIIVRDMPFYSVCEHHLLPFEGMASIGYRPVGNAVIGLSKLPRLVDVYARRLQIQERLTYQIFAALVTRLECEVAVKIVSRHNCVSARGIGVAGVSMETWQVTPGREDYWRTML